MPNMTETELSERYFHYLCGWVTSDKLVGVSYDKLLRHLHRVKFYSLISRDKNRVSDAIDFRYRFAGDYDIDPRIVASVIDISESASILEVMIALAVRYEEHIMSDCDFGSRVGQWFWEMIVNLGLGSQSDENYDASYVHDILEKFLNRDYDEHGRGGLFFVSAPREDMRQTEIWYQMCWHMQELYH